MEILWTVDTNITWAMQLSKDHLHKVATCIDKSKEIILLPSVGAEIKSTLDNNIAKIMASALAGKTTSYEKNSLVQKIYSEITQLKKYYPQLKDSAITEFKESVYRYVSIKTVQASKKYLSYRREIEMDKLRPYINAKKGVGAIADAYKKYVNKVFLPIINKINLVFPYKKQSKDKEILIDLINISYHYPEIQICFLTNDKDFYRRWKRVCDTKEYTLFLKENNIKYRIIFHYIPDLENETIDSYDMYPKPASEEKALSLYQILTNCS